MSPKKKQPCIYCGGPKESGQGRRVCVACEETRKPLILQQQYIDRLARTRENRDRSNTPMARRPAPEGMRWCSRCAEYRPLDQFGTRGPKKLATYCKPCYSIYLHERTLDRLYGITLDEYQDLFDLQDGRCAICQTKPRKRRLSVDHDHETGAVRGLLCTRCNHKLLGAAHDSAPMLRRAAAYLGAPPARTRRPIPSALEDLISLLFGAWLDELREVKEKAGARLGAVWIEPASGGPGQGHVLMAAEDYESLCDQVRSAA